MNNEELLEKENEIPGTENNVEAEQPTQDDAETGTAEGGRDEAAAEVAESDDVEDIENQVAPEAEVEDVVETEPETEPEMDSEPEEKMLTQSQVNELVGKARAEGRQSALKELYGRYGVNDDNEMNDIFGRGQGYDLLNEEYNALNGKYGQLSAENALLKSQIVSGRWDDVKAILGSKGLPVTSENIEAEMATHPEWRGASQVTQMPGTDITPQVAEMMAETAKPQPAEPTQPSQIRKLGSTVPEPKVDTEDNEAMRYFGL